MAIEVEAGLAEHLAETSGSAHFELRDFGDAGAAAAAMEQAKRAVFSVPHPEEPDDPLPSYASDLPTTNPAIGFWIDMADAEAYDGLIDQVVAKVVSALDEAGIDGRLTWPGGP
jgi:hypothetical protein